MLFVANTFWSYFPEYEHNGIFFCFIVVIKRTIMVLICTLTILKIVALPWYHQLITILVTWIPKCRGGFVLNYALLPWTCDDFHRQKTFVYRILFFLTLYLDILSFTFILFLLLYVALVERVNVFRFRFLL